MRTNTRTTLSTNMNLNTSTSMNKNTSMSTKMNMNKSTSASMSMKTNKTRKMNVSTAMNKSGTMSMNKITNRNKNMNLNVDMCMIEPRSMTGNRRMTEKMTRIENRSISENRSMARDMSRHRTNGKSKKRAWNRTIGKSKQRVKVNENVKDLHLPTIEYGLESSEVDSRFRGALKVSRLSDSVLAFYLREIDRRGLWKDLGYSSVFHYAKVVAGFGERKVYSLLRIARELDEYRQIRTAFTEGRIPWTKAREILKVVTPNTEGRWLAVAITKNYFELEEMVGEARAAIKRKMKEMEE